REVDQAELRKTLSAADVGRRHLLHLQPVPEPEREHLREVDRARVADARLDDELRRSAVVEAEAVAVVLDRAAQEEPDGGAAGAADEPAPDGAVEDGAAGHELRGDDDVG